MTAPLATQSAFAAPADLGPTTVKAVLQEVLASSGRSSQSPAMWRVLDIGCGSGALVRALLRLGFSVTGVDPDARMLQAALIGPRPAPPGHWIAGQAEHLPVACGSVDVVIFLNSLHHVVVDCQVAALAEAARVLCPGGDLLIIEPSAAGSYFELLAPLDDETLVRAAAQAAVRAVAGRLLQPVAAVRFSTTVAFADPAAVLASFIKADPTRAALIDRAEPQIVQRFSALGSANTEGARCFEQPMTLHHLRKA